MIEDQLHVDQNTTTLDREVLVKVEGVSKKFCRSLKKSLWYGVKDIASEIVGKDKTQELRADEFWAVNDVSFELRRGDCLGLIGHNGAGKSTLLKMLNGLIKPDKGTITMKGRIGALIELGAGFNPILTGRENIYNNAAVLGFSKEEVDAKLEDIIEFAEIRDFIDTPVQNYSSGMKVRLGFAVAAQMEPDVLIIDEVLAVGDVGFRLKCISKISELIRRTCVIFVSHSMTQISRVSTGTMLLERGRVKFLGEISMGIQKYYELFSNENRLELGVGGATIYGSDVAVSYSKNMSAELRISIELKLNISNKAYLWLMLWDQELKPVADIYAGQNGICLRDTLESQCIEVNCPNINLASGKYMLSAIIVDGFGRVLKRVDNMQAVIISTNVHTQAVINYMLDSNQITFK
ncbi:ABC transporter ATP-binding protein [Sediminitomix flava]|uniref:Lipopolysaccharide transport system ATP-binding protein n=1 Tax=Sediminitomix flava TaxID=379075 RepID=A0A315ZDT7_SEDFL|nr:ABC transporter ATP-binding protein [Sediminitomix flava]PWJ43313.1 lipopolysaccharide transport system ATP-binding protein [Sediminitomix flava]